MGISVVGILLIPRAKNIFALMPIAYLLIERHLRCRSWTDLGIRLRTFKQDFYANWFWVVLVGLISQPLAALVAYAWIPEVIVHIRGRLPLDLNNLIVTIPLMVIAVFGEELTFRSLLQGRLTLFIKAPAAVTVTALVFALVHFAPGAFIVVAFDLATVFIDAVLFGIIYARSGNVTVTWAAHFLGNVLGLIAILML